MGEKRRPKRGVSGRPKREERPKRSEVFSEEADEDFGADFEAEEFPDEDYEDFSTGHDWEEEPEEFEEVTIDDGDPDTFTDGEAASAPDGPRRVRRPKRGERPKRDARPKRERPKRGKEVEEGVEAKEEPEEVLQVRHRRVREDEVVEDEPQMFSFSSDINRMTVSTMLAGVNLNDYDFGEDGNLIKVSENKVESQEEKLTSMQAVESLDDLLSGLENSIALSSDEEIERELETNVGAVETQTEANAEAKAEVQAPAAEVATQEVKTEVKAEVQKPSKKSKPKMRVDKPHPVVDEKIERTKGAAKEVTKEVTKETEEAEEVAEEVAEAIEEATSEEVSESASESASKSASEAEEAIEEKGLMERLQSASFKFKEHVLNTGIDSLSDIEVRYRYDGDYRVIPSNRNTLSMPNCKVYKKGRGCPWTKAQEVRLKQGEKILLDFGTSVILPKGFGMRVIYCKNILTKFGLEPVEEERVFGSMECATNLSLEFTALNSMSYVARYQPLVDLEVVKLNGED